MMDPLAALVCQRAEKQIHLSVLSTIKTSDADMEIVKYSLALWHTASISITLQELLLLLAPLRRFTTSVVIWSPYKCSRK